VPLPTGPAVAFLFTDIEGSTRLERSVGSHAWASLVARHDDLLRAAIEGSGGVVVKTEGDAFFAAFDRPAGAVTAAAAAQRAVATEPWGDGLAIRVRMGLHLGEGRLRVARAAGDPEDYVGIDVNYAARIAAAANGGQVVLSDALVGALPRAIARLPGLADTELVDEGPRTVKDFEEPTPLFRLVVPGAADDTRPLRTLDVPTNLPGDVTTLVGRDAEIGRVRAELLDGRIVTLTGPGGSGKTRLALAVARDLRDRFPHGVWFVDLAAVADPALLVPAIAAALGVRESPDHAIDEALRAHLRERTTLVLLDNLEQLLPDGAGTVARLVRDAPNLRVLATSRELLRISGERGYPVPPLGLEAGIELFVDRARPHRPDLSLTDDAMAAIRSIAVRLDGLPLAIELAAARVRVLAPAQILDRLGRSLDLGGGARDLPERQRTLRGAVAWSYDLLPVAERRLFARLSVFADGWTPDAALAVADPDGDLGVDLAEGLESLADKSLIRPVTAADGAASGVGSPVPAGDAEVRLGMHPLLREYGLERLDESGERARIEARFAAVCVEIAAVAGGGILGASGEASLARLDREDRNLRAAVERSIAGGDTDVGLRIIGMAWRWFQQRGRLREARAVLAQLLGRPRDGDVRIRIAALAAEGGLAYWMNDFAGAGAAYEERLVLATDTGDPVLLADAHYDIGFLSMVEGDGARLRAHEQAALDLYTTAGVEDGVLRARQALVLAVFLAGDYARAAALERENLAVFRRRGSLFQVADSGTLLAAVRWRLGEPGAAWASALESLRFFLEVDSASGLARALGMAAIIQLSDGDAELGSRIAGATYRIVREKGVMLAPVKVLHLPDPAGLAIERLGAERAAALMAEGEALPLDEVVALVGAAAPPAG
jgi:predicted ATPase/class 3 adenylate cyclase